MIDRTKASVWLVGCALALGAAGCAAHRSPGANTPTASLQGRAQVTIEVPGVGCAGCDPKVRAAVKSAGGVLDLDDGHPEDRVVVSYQPGAGRPAAYVAALHKAGFVKARSLGAS